MIKNSKEKSIKFLKYFTVFSLIFIVVCIVGLELLSKYYQCPKVTFPKHPDCYTFTNIENGDWVGGYIFDFYFDKEDKKWLEELREKRKEGVKITKEEYHQASEKFMIEVSKDEMPDLNGISCGDFGYVRDDLPSSAKIFVKRHEFEHMMQEGVKVEGNKEFLANLAALKEYPLGGVQTALFSVFRNRAGNNNNITCRIIRLWQLFKIYFLPFKSESIYN